GCLRASIRCVHPCDSGPAPESACADSSVPFRGLSRRQKRSNPSLRERAKCDRARPIPVLLSDSISAHRFGEDEFPPERNPRSAAPRGQNRHSLHDVPKFTRVPRPRICFKQRKNILIELLRSKIVSPAEIIEEIFGHRPNVLRPLTKRRHTDRYYAEPVIEVFTKLLLCNHLREAAVGRR